MKILLFSLLLLGCVLSVSGAFCPFREDEYCTATWSSGGEGASGERFWSMYRCPARGYPAAYGTPCYSTTPYRDSGVANPSSPSWTHQTDAAIRRKFSISGDSAEGFWNEIHREAQLNKPSTENWGQTAHIAVLRTGDGRPFLINHGILPFTRESRRVFSNAYTETEPTERIIERLAPRATWSVCTQEDCSETTKPVLFSSASSPVGGKALPTFFNWNPCGQSSSAHVWINGESRLTFVGVGSRTSWTDGRVVLGQCVDAACSDVIVVDVGSNMRDLPPVEHQCLNGYNGVGARIVVAADGNPSIMWRDRFSPENVVYIHCANPQCTDIVRQETFRMPNEVHDLPLQESQHISDSQSPPPFGTQNSKSKGSPDAPGGYNDLPTPSPALWWDLISSERGIWLVTLNSGSQAVAPYPYIQVTKCTESTCNEQLVQFPSSHFSGEKRASQSGQGTFFGANGAHEFFGGGWAWAINGKGKDPTAFANTTAEYGDVAFAASTFSAGVTGDGYPMWVGQLQNGPQSVVAWAVCSCRDDSCATPLCHFLADSNSIMDPAVAQCVSSQELEADVLQNHVPRFVHYAARHRILPGTSDGLPIIAQMISSFCVQINPLSAHAQPYGFAESRLEEMIYERHSQRFENLNKAPSVADRKRVEIERAKAPHRSVLLQSQKTLYIHCLDATCSEASVSALESPKVGSVSHEAGYNQVDSLVLASDRVLTVYTPDVTAYDQSYSWSQPCAYEVVGIDTTDSLKLVTYDQTFQPLYTTRAIRQVSGFSPPYAYDSDGNLFNYDGNSGTVKAYDLRYGTVVYELLFPSNNCGIGGRPDSMAWDRRSNTLYATYVNNGNLYIARLSQSLLYDLTDMLCVNGGTSGCNCNSVPTNNAPPTCSGRGGFQSARLTVASFRQPNVISLDSGYAESRFDLNLDEVWNPNSPGMAYILALCGNGDNAIIATNAPLWAGFLQRQPSVAGPCATQEQDEPCDSALSTVFWNERQPGSIQTTSFWYNERDDSLNIASRNWNSERTPYGVMTIYLSDNMNLAYLRPYLESSKNSRYMKFTPVQYKDSTNDAWPLSDGRAAVRPNEFCSPSERLATFDGASLGGLADVSRIPNFVLLRDYLGLSPTPRTSGLKTWLTSRWSSPNGLPCQESQVGKTITADEVVFLCSGLGIGNDIRWGTTPIAGWTRFWEWQDLSWGLRWRWQGDVHLGTDHSNFGSEAYPYPTIYDPDRLVPVDFFFNNINGNINGRAAE